ncbi:hypothetical protein [Ruegeria meonggei]|uniref:hypothetical protein n=1 Tax=Ruegeria meonggei TaxID=1446476 RepID=UPI003671D2EB
MISEQNARALEAHSNSGLPFRISLRSVNKGVGAVALGLPFALLLAGKLGHACASIDSISHYYYTRVGGDILVGALSFIGVLLLFFYRLPGNWSGTTGDVDGYLGHKPLDMWLLRIAGLCALGVAFFPTSGTGCEMFNDATARVFLLDTQGGHGLSSAAVTGKISFDFWAQTGVTNKILLNLHFISAAGMFLVLAYFSIFVFTRPQSKRARGSKTDIGYEVSTLKWWRNAGYYLFGGLILLAIAALAIKAIFLSDKPAIIKWWDMNNLTFWFEALALVAFGLSWSLKGRLWPFSYLSDS